MKFFKYLLFLIVSLSVFASYTVILKNGATITTKEKPDFSKTLIQVVSSSGKKLVLKKEIIDIEASEKFNMPKKKTELQSNSDKKNISNSKSKTNTQNTSTKKEIVITDKNFKRTVEPTNKTSVKNKNNSSKHHYYENMDAPMSETEDTGGGESYWKSVFAMNKSNIDLAESKLKKMEELMSKFASSKLQSTDTMYIMNISKEMDTLQIKINKQKEKVKLLKQQKSDLLEKARKSGALPGWYRDYE